jgi:hypothetical protein
VHLLTTNLFSCVVPSFCGVVGCAVLLCSDHFITVSPEISSVIRPVLFRTQVYNITLPVCLSRGGRKDWRWH